jgi:PAS domain S-box-containing protein
MKRESEEIIQNLQARNEVLSRQVISLIQSRHFGEESSPAQDDSFRTRLEEFIWRISGKGDDEDLYQQIADEFLLELKADRITMMVQGSGPQQNLVVTQQAQQSHIPLVPLPYFLSFEPEDRFRGFLQEVLDSSRVITKHWAPPVTTHLQLEMQSTSARRLDVEYGGTWVVCAEWKEPREFSANDYALFEQMASYAEIVMEQAQLASSIKELSDQNESLIESMPSAIIGLDFLGSITFWNGKAEEFFGLAEEDVLGKVFWSVAPRFSHLADALLNVMSTDEELVLDSVLFRSPSGRMRHLQPHLFSMFSVDRGEIALRIDDITHQVDLQQQLLHAQKMETVGALSGGIAADFSTLLSEVQTAAQEMLTRWRRKDIPAKDRQALETILQSSQQASDLANRLQILSRPQDDTISKVDLVHCLRSLTVLCKSGFQENISVRWQSEVESAMIAGVENQLENAILNLCVNARDAMPEGGQIDLRLSRFKPDEAFCTKHNVHDIPAMFRVEVCDSGEGMTEEVREKIFDVFFTTREHSGTGLGLTIVERIMENHRGFIELVSEPGQGTCFTLYFPEPAPGVIESLPEKTLPPHSGHHGESILLVQDEDEVRGALERILAGMDYTVHTTDSGTDTISKVDEGGNYAVIILDLNQKGISGTDTWHLLRRMRPNQRILLCITPEQEEESTEASRDASTHLLIKPFTFDQLEAALSSLLC